MAIELKGTIELKDIAAIEFRCKKCGHASIRRLDGLLRLPALCGNCDSQWRLNEGPEGQNLLGFLHSFTSQAAKDRPFSLRFHVEGLEGFTGARQP